MRIVEVPMGSVGLDFLRVPTLAEIIAISGFVLPGSRSGITFVERYLENLTTDEINAWNSNGTGVVVIGESRANGYIPTAADGDADGAREVARARALGIPTGGYIGCDLEGMAGSAADTQAYSRSWCGRVQANDKADVYEGAGVPLTPQQLYTLPFTGYYRSLSNVQPVAVVDYFMFQLFPTITISLPTGPYQVDVDVVGHDKKMRLPTMVVS